jgi:hypothetical protein
MSKREPPQVILVDPALLFAPEGEVRYGEWEELVSEPNPVMLQYVPAELAMLELAAEMDAAYDREKVLGEQLNDHIDQLKAVEERAARLFAQAEKLAHERDAYKRAKSENDERFMNERDGAREEAAAARHLLKIIHQYGTSTGVYQQIEAHLKKYIYGYAAPPMDDTRPQDMREAAEREIQSILEHRRRNPR